MAYKEFILMPVTIGTSRGFIIPRRQFPLAANKQYKVKVSEVGDDG